VLYGLKSSGAAWKAHLAEVLHDLGYVSSLADPNVWFHAETKDDGFKHYAYVLVCIDDILVVPHNPMSTMQALSEHYRLKNGFAPPTRYLGATIKKWQLTGNEVPSYWGHSSEEYVKQAIANVEKELLLHNHCLNGQFSTPMTQGYRPELDYSPIFGRLCSKLLYGADRHSTLDS
jgi:hypothetical protein